MSQKPSITNKRLTLSGPDDPEAYANRIYSYCPSYGAAIFFTIIFILVMLAHIVQAIIFRKSFCWVIAMAALWEAIGWGFRAASAQHEDKTVKLDTNLNVISTVFILVAPIWLNAFAYMTFGRMVNFFLPERKVWKISARWLTLIFVMLDILSFIIQIIGALLLTGSNGSQDSINAGVDTYMSGVGVQEAFILCFFGLSLMFWREAKRWPVYREKSPMTLLYVLWAALVLISVRIIYRIVEYSSGRDSYATTHEWTIYVFDATPMFIAILLFNFYHPGKALVGPESEFPKLSREQKREQKLARKNGTKLVNMGLSQETMV